MKDGKWKHRSLAAVRHCMPIPYQPTQTAYWDWSEVGTHTSLASNSIVPFIGLHHSSSFGPLNAILSFIAAILAVRGFIC